MKRVLITGATGYIGSRLAGALTQDCAVYALVRQPLNEAYLTPELRDRLTLLPYDGGGESVAAALAESRPETVYHLAAHYTAAHDMESITKLVDSNLLLGAYLLEAMSMAGCRRLVYHPLPGSGLPAPHPLRGGKTGLLRPGGLLHRGGEAAGGSAGPVRHLRAGGPAAQGSEPDPAVRPHRGPAGPDLRAAGL